MQIPEYMACIHSIFSDGYETNQMILEWLDEGAVEVAEDLEMPQFDMYDYKAEGCVHKYKTGRLDRTIRELVFRPL